MSDRQSSLKAVNPIAAPMAPILPEQVPIGYTVDELYDFFDFFDATVDDVTAYILHSMRVPAAVETIAIDVYLSLLQRRRFFFWKQTAKLATAFAFADRVIASKQRWREEGESGAYMQELLRCVPSKKENEIERLRQLQYAIRSLPYREQRMVVLACFLRFSASRTAALLGVEKITIEREYAAVFNTLAPKLQANAAFRNVNAQEYLGSMHCPTLTEEQRRSLRHLLLERCQSGRGSSVRFALPVAVLVLLTTSVVSLSVVPPLSAAETRRKIAAVEVLLLTKEDTVVQSLREAERSVQTISASYAENELADIAINLAPFAVRKQVTQDVTMRRLLKDWEDAGRPLLSALETLLSYRDASF